MFQMMLLKMQLAKDNSINYGPVIKVTNLVLRCLLFVCNSSRYMERGRLKAGAYLQNTKT